MVWIEIVGWKIYLIIFSLFTLGSTISIFYENSYSYLYYNILIAFHKSYLLSYWFAIISNIINSISLITLYLYISRTKLWNVIFWRWLFVFRVVFDLVGHAFEFKTIKSLFYSDQWLGVITISLAAAVLLPSYLASFRYAFHQEKVFKD